MRILVIEYFPPTLQERLRRKEFWLEIQKTYDQRGIDISIPEQCPQNSTGNRTFSFQGVDLLFVHESDNDAGFTALAEREGKPFVCYGGRSTESEHSRVSELKIDFLPISLLMSNLEPFLERVLVDGKITVDALYVLIGYDPILEATLKLLHACLTPNGAKTARSIQNYELIKEKVELVKHSFPKKDQNGKEIKDGQSKEEVVIDGLSGLGEDKIFEPEYIEPLERLRDELLKDYK